ncbi:MAG: thioredoxin-dependent thiol peroxidase [Verrucomicrobiales bacterium]|nr:thioredoxin-dependent thiol peroxidase [Verrucomicrobiales bacterium]
MPKGPSITLRVGDHAPDFEAPASGGGTVSLSGLRGRHVVLYFYPKDDTPGCTTEACGFRDAHAALTRKGAVVLGVSPDPVKSHDRFVAKFSLPFALVSDPEHTIAEAYGVWGEKKFMGRTYQGVHRVTFLVGPDGRIAAIWPSVKPAEHPAEVLAALAVG